MAVLPTNHMVLTRPRPRARPRCWRGTRCRKRAGPRRPPGGCSPWPRAGGWRPGPRWCWAGRSLGPCPEKCHRYQTLLLCRQRRRHSITEPQFPNPVPAASSMPALLQSINSFSTKRNRFLHFLQKGPRGPPGIASEEETTSTAPPRPGKQSKNLSVLEY